MADLMAVSSNPRRKWLVWFLEGLVVVIIVTGIQYWRTRDAASGEAPPLSAQLLDGGKFSLGDGPGQPLLVHFWATWCPICRLGQGSIAALAEEGRVITVALSSGSDAEVRQYLRDEGVAFPVINDPTGEIAANWGVMGVPASFVVDGSANIRFVTSGYTTGPGLRLRLWLAESEP
jgi:thiol-disulfide isomerase/thioredoxin